MLTHDFTTVRKEGSRAKAKGKEGQVNMKWLKAALPFRCVLHGWEMGETPKVLRFREDLV